MKIPSTSRGVDSSPTVPRWILPDLLWSLCYRRYCVTGGAVLEQGTSFSPNHRVWQWGKGWGTAVVVFMCQFQMNTKQ